MAAAGTPSREVEYTLWADFHLPMVSSGGSKSSFLLTSVSPCGLPIVLGKGGGVKMTAGLRSCGFSQLETSHGGGGLCHFGKSPVMGVETLGEGWGVSQPSASVSPIETWVFPRNWIVFP